MPKYADVNVGDELPPYDDTPMRIHLVQYAAGSGDFNPLHYDADFPQAKTLGGNIVHGRRKFSGLGRVVSNWLGHSGRIRTISCQYRGMDMFGETYTVKGVVTAKREEGGAKLVDLDVWTETAAGKKTTPGRATVELNA